MEELINSNTSPAPYSKILDLASIVQENVSPGIDIFSFDGGQFQDFIVGRWRGVVVDSKKRCHHVDKDNTHTLLC